MVRFIDCSRCAATLAARLGLILLWVAAVGLTGPEKCATASSLTPGIYGTVYYDTNNNGAIDPGEALSGMTMSLYRDDGDGVFNPADQLIGSPVVTDLSGVYSFPDLEDAGYFVQQSATPSYLALVSPLTRPGDADLLIDDFVTSMSLHGNPFEVVDSQSVMNMPADPSISSLRQVDLILLSGVGRASVTVNPIGGESRLVYSTSAGVTGLVLVNWDFSAVDPSGNEVPNVAPIDLTENGQRNGLMLQVGIDQAGSNDPITVRLTGDDPSEVSTASVNVPATNGFDTSFVFVPFVDFVGTADPTSVLSVELELGNGSPSVDASVDTFGVLGPKSRDFSVVSNSVPEPASFGLVVVAVLGTFVVFRREMN